MFGLTLNYLAYIDSHFGLVHNGPSKRNTQHSLYVYTKISMVHYPDPFMKEVPSNYCLKNDLNVYQPMKLLQVLRLQHLGPFQRPLPSRQA